MIRRPLSLELLAAAIAVHEPEPARRALLALALLDDRHLAVITSLPLGAHAGALRDLLLDEGMRADARLRGLATAAATWPLTAASPAALDLAQAVDAVTVSQLASVTPWQGLVRAATPHRKAPKRRVAKWERDLEAATSVRIPA